MNDIQDYYESKFLEKQEEISSLKEKVKTLEQENAHLRKVNGIKLKKTTIKQSLVYANDALVKEKEKVKELEADNHRLKLGSMSAFDHQRLIEWLKDPNRKEAKIAFTAGVLRDAAVAYESSRITERISTLHSQIAVLHRGLEDIGKILDKGGWSRVAEMIVAKTLSSNGSELLEAVREAKDAIENILEPMLHLLHKVMGENAREDILARMEKLQGILSKLRRFV